MSGKGLTHQYIVKTPRGDVVEGYLDIDVPELTEEFLASHKTDILMETSKRGHTHINVVVFIKKGVYRAKCYYKRYGILPFICSLFVILILCFAYSYGTIDNVLCYLMTLVISAVGLAYKAHSDKEQKNKPVFKARRECFDELRAIMDAYFRLMPRSDAFQANSSVLQMRVIALFKKGREYFNGEIVSFLDNVQGAMIHILYIEQTEKIYSRDDQNGRTVIAQAGLEKNRQAAETFLTKLLAPEFESKYREFELNMFKPEEIDPMLAKSWKEAFYVS